MQQVNHLRLTNQSNKESNLGASSSMSFTFTKLNIMVTAAAIGMYLPTGPRVELAIDMQKLQC